MNLGILTDAIGQATGNGVTITGALKAPNGLVTGSITNSSGITIGGALTLSQLTTPGYLRVDSGGLVTSSTLPPPTSIDTATSTLSDVAPTLTTSDGSVAFYSNKTTHNLEHVHWRRCRSAHDHWSQECRHRSRRWWIDWPAKAISTS